MVFFWPKRLFSSFFWTSSKPFLNRNCTWFNSMPKSLFFGPKPGTLFGGFWNKGTQKWVILALLGVRGIMVRGPKFIIWQYLLAKFWGPIQMASLAFWTEPKKGSILGPTFGSKLDQVLGPFWPFSFAPDYGSIYDLFGYNLKKCEKGVQNGPQLGSQNPRNAKPKSDPKWPKSDFGPKTQKWPFYA